MKCCTKCGSELKSGYLFCGNCGQAVIETASAAAIPSTPISEDSSSHHLASVTKSPLSVKKKSWWITFSLILVAALAIWVVSNYLRNNRSDGNYSADLYQPEPVDKEKIEKTANKVEDVFFRSDTADLAYILSPESLEQRRQYFADIKPYMAEFGKAFRNRKLIFASARYAEYEFNSPSGKFTVALCLGPDCTWKLMRY